MGHFQNTSVQDENRTILRERPEWIIQVKAARRMIEVFPDMLSAVHRRLFFAKEEMPLVRDIADLAGNAKKCKQLNSVEYMCKPIKTQHGFRRVTYYHLGDVVFVTTPGEHDGQKIVASIFSLSEKLAQMEETRIAMEKTGKKRVPMSRIRKMRQTSFGRQYFRNNS
jgi:hypothetical protein